MVLERRKFNRLAKYLSLKKYCDKRYIPFKLELCEFSSIIEKQCYYCKIKRYINNLMLRDILKGYTYDNVNPICDNCLSRIKH